MSANSPPRVSKKRRENDRERKEREEGRKEESKERRERRKARRKEGRKEEVLSSGHSKDPIQQVG